jgi:3-methyladenine DNA glycosylase AlkD
MADHLSKRVQIALAIQADLEALPVRNTSRVRSVRRKYSQYLKNDSPELVFGLARLLLHDERHDERHEERLRWIAYELVRSHQAAFQQVGPAELQEFGQGIHSWDTVDAFARTLSGPAWLRGQIDDELIHRWAHSEDLWWRRAALVSTVALNMRSQAGPGDTPRTLAVCRLLVADQEDMVVKAMSWALRELVVHDPQAVQAFLKEHDGELNARIKREVRNKLRTGLKNPGKDSRGPAGEKE